MLYIYLMFLSNYFRSIQNILYGPRGQNKFWAHWSAIDILRKPLNPWVKRFHGLSGEILQKFSRAVHRAPFENSRNEAGCPGVFLMWRFQWYHCRNYPKNNFSKVAISVVRGIKHGKPNYFPRQPLASPASQAVLLGMFLGMISAKRTDRRWPVFY